MIWGLSPIYFKAVAHVEPAEVLAHRVVWALILLGAMLAFTGALRAALRGLCDPKQFLRCSTTAVLVSINWLIFIWAIQNDRVLEASLGYFINPLVSVALGVLLLTLWRREMKKRPA